MVEERKGRVEYFFFFKKKAIRFNYFISNLHHVISK